MIDIARKSYFYDNDVREVEVGLLDGGDDGEYKDDGLVEISKIFGAQDDLSMGLHHLTEYNNVWDIDGMG